MNNPITEPVPGYYLIAGSGNWKLPARISRLCNCTINGEEEHEWQDSCDRFPPLVVEIFGQVQEDSHDPVADAWRTAVPLEGQGGLSPDQEYNFLCADEKYRLAYRKFKNKKPEKTIPIQKPDLGKMEPIF